MPHADLECWLVSARLVQQSQQLQPLRVEPHRSYPPGVGLCPPAHAYPLHVSFAGDGGQTQLDALVGGAALHLALTHELVAQFNSQKTESQVVREAPEALTAVRRRAESNSNLVRIANFIVPPELVPSCIFRPQYDQSQEWICATYVKALIALVSSISPDSVQALARWLLHHDLVAVASSRRMLEPQRWGMRLRKPY